MRPLASSPVPRATRGSEHLSRLASAAAGRTPTVSCLGFRRRTGRGSCHTRSAPPRLRGPPPAPTRTMATAARARRPPSLCATRCPGRRSRPAAAGLDPHHADGSGQSAPALFRTLWSPRARPPGCPVPGRLVRPAGAIYLDARSRSHRRLYTRGRRCVGPSRVYPSRLAGVAVLADPESCVGARSSDRGSRVPTPARSRARQPRSPISVSARLGVASRREHGTRPYGSGRAVRSVGPGTGTRFGPALRPLSTSSFATRTDRARRVMPGLAPTERSSAPFPRVPRDIGHSSPTPRLRLETGVRRPLSASGGPRERGARPLADGFSAGPVENDLCPFHPRRASRKRGSSATRAGLAARHDLCRRSARALVGTGPTGSIGIYSGTVGSSPAATPRMRGRRARSPVEGRRCARAGVGRRRAGSQTPLAAASANLPGILTGPGAPGSHPIRSRPLAISAADRSKSERPAVQFSRRSRSCGLLIIGVGLSTGGTPPGGAGVPRARGRIRASEPARGRNGPGRFARSVKARPDHDPRYDRRAIAV